MQRIYYYRITVSLFAVLFFFGACRKDSITEDDTILYPDPVVYVEGDVLGLVSDESGSPVGGATIILGNKTSQTDANGVFKITGLMNRNLPFVRVEKAGYFPSLASFSVKAGSMGRVKATLRPKTLAGQLNAATGGTVQIPGGGSVRFAEAGMKDNLGQPYNGPVSVYATYLDPSQPGIEGLVPGGFLGRSAAGQTEVLTSFGMVKVLLETPGGQPLQITKPAEVTMPVPADRLSKAPATIPLWYIDETTGYWKEEGSATLQGNVYVGTVTHFSWWNCDIGFPVVQLSGRVRLGNEQPFVWLRITNANGLSAITTSDADGLFSGGVPQNQTFLFEVINECGDVVYSATLGPFSSDTDIGIISVSGPSNWVQVQGSLVNCSQQPVTNGFVSFRTNGSPATGNFPVPVDPTDGTFSGYIANCNGTEVTLTAIDLNEQLSSDPITLPISTTIDFGQVDVCDNPVTTGMIIEFANGTKKAIPILSAIMGVDSALGNIYQFIALDNQPDGSSARYEIYFLNWSGNPNSPQWALTYDLVLNGNPVRYDVQSVGPVATPALGTLPGEPVQFVVSNVVLKESPSGIEYPQCKITLSGILQ